MKPASFKGDNDVGEAQQNVVAIMNASGVQKCTMVLTYEDGSTEALDLQIWKVNEGWLNYVTKEGGSLRAKRIQGVIKELEIIPDDPEFRPKPYKDSRRVVN